MDIFCVRVMYVVLFLIWFKFTIQSYGWWQQSLQFSVIIDGFFALSTKYFAVHYLIHLLQKGECIIFKKSQRYSFFLIGNILGQLFMDYIQKCILQFPKCCTRFSDSWCIFYNLDVYMALKINSYEYVLHFIPFERIFHKVILMDFVFDCAVEYERDGEFGVLNLSYDFLIVLWYELLKVSD